MSRCIDELGQVQPTREQVSKVYNKPPDYYHDHGIPGSDNSVVPWKIGSDGSVHNGIA